MVRTAEPGDSVTGPPAPFPGRRLRRVLVVMVRRLPRPELARDGPRVALLHEGRDPLAKGCAYCTKVPPTTSTPNPPPVAPHPRAVHPGDAGNHQCDRGSPSDRSKQQLSHRSPIWQTHPTGVLRCHDIRNSQKS